MRLSEPNGYQIEVMHGIAGAAADPGARDTPMNTGAEPLRRAGR